MVSEAQRTRAPIQRLADRVASYFVPAVLAAAVITFVCWAVFGPQPRYAHALVNAVAVLIIACPCALGLATPMSIMVGTGRGAGEGILVRNAEALETLEKVDTLVVDKTGTLTEGKPRLSTVIAAEGMDETQLLQMMASLEKASEHPLAAAILAAAQEKKIELLPVANFASLTGKGVSGTVQGKQVAAGNAALMHDLGASSQAMEQQAEALRQEGQTVMFLASDGRLAGLVAVADPIRESAPRAIQELKQEGIKVVMVTGDNRTTAAAMAQKLGIDFEAEVLPAQKAEVSQKVAIAGSGGGHGGRWRQRCARAGAGAGRHRHGYRNGRGDGVWRHRPGQGGSARHSQGAALKPANHGQHPPESLLRLHLQRPWRAARRRCALPGIRIAAQPHDRRRRYELQLGLRHHQRAAAAQGFAIVSRFGFVSGYDFTQFVND